MRQNDTKRYILRALLFLLILPLPALADDATFPTDVNLQPLQTLTVQHRETLKTLDTYARQTITAITGRPSLDNRPALYTVLDMAASGQDYLNRNIIKVSNIPLRQDLASLDGLDPAEKKRIVKEGTVSLAYWLRPDVQTLLQQTQMQATYKASAIEQVQGAAITLASLIGRQSEQTFIVQSQFPPVALVAPATSSPADHAWHTLEETWGNVLARPGVTPPPNLPKIPPLANYDNELLARINAAAANLTDNWIKRNAAGVNSDIATLADLLPQVNPAVYPSPTKRQAEVIYNRLYKMTLPGVFFYFVGFVCFLASARSGIRSLRTIAVIGFIIGFFIHTMGIGVRWWLVGSIFPPIKNQFESVMFSAWFGAMVALVLEAKWPRGIFGAAASFVGWVALAALVAAPYVAGRDIGGEIGQVGGILMTYWLYIHVTMVTASYALIGMGFLLSAWWIIQYLIDARRLRAIPSEELSADAVTGPRSAGASSALAAALPETRDAQTFLATLDSCNLVILQLAFWILGLGIITGAIWADQSWGRPWGWDPKETFALVTWIVYLIVVHVRVVTKEKAFWTSALSIVGFAIMLFNWIGVNFFLVGLHSYA